MTRYNSQENGNNPSEILLDYRRYYITPTDQSVRTYLALIYTEEVRFMDITLEEWAKQYVHARKVLNKLVRVYGDVNEQQGGSNE